MDSYSRLVELLLEIKNILNSPNTDVTWSKYQTVEEAFLELDICIKRLTQRDKSVILELKTLFAPTGSLQEISIDSGWGHYFIELSSRFDNIVISI